MKWVFSFSLHHLSETYIILRRNEQDTIINAHLSLGKVPTIIVRF